jgi:hypothetical protein
MSVSLVKAELQVFTNYDADCREFHSLVVDDEKLLNAAAGNTKYVWKKRASSACSVSANK